MTSDVGDVQLDTFTDEELSVLCGPSGIVVAPFLGTIEAPDRPAVERTAYRGLLARGIIEPPTQEALAAAVPTASGTAAVALSVRQDVHALVTLRTAAQGVVAIARTTADAQDFWYAHVVDDVVLIETVDASGMHAFSLSEERMLAEVVVQASLHPKAADADGEPVAVEFGSDPQPSDVLLQRLGDSFVRADLVARAPGDKAPELLGVFSGPAGSWLMRSTFGSGGHVTARPVKVDDLRAAITEQVSALLNRTVRSHASQKETAR